MTDVFEELLRVIATNNKPDQTPPSAPKIATATAAPPTQSEVAADHAALAHPLCRQRQIESYNRVYTYLSHNLQDALLTQEGQVDDKLRKQLEVLHSLFQITAHQVSGTRAQKGEAPEPYFNSDYLDYALRLQEKSVQTAKALAQISYMQHLIEPSKPPHPLIANEQTKDEA